MSRIVLPYESEYVGHREALERRQRTLEWLRRRESELSHIAPSIVPTHEPEDEHENGA